jgi:phosphoglycolate phosphatase
MVRGILFDKDGTLIDFRRTWTPAYLGLAMDLAARAEPEAGPLRVQELATSLLARLGYQAAADQFAPDSLLLWATNDEVAAKLADEPELVAVDVPAVAEAHFSDVERYPPIPVGDLGQLFGRLRDLGLYLGIATMDTTDAAHWLSHRLGLAGHLAYLAGFDAGDGAKPSAGMVLGFCAATGLVPAEVVVVGDTRADMAMARAAGAHAAVAVLTGALPASALLPYADHVLDTVHDLEAWLSATGRLASAVGGR